jgi:16S rRNA (adenine1518-N6/adenine1519-N6)-dimethyltransferase
MTKTELKKLLDKLDLNPSRRLGQNFLIDDNMLEAIVRDAGIEAGDTILEIGPGTGVLTVKLLESGCNVIAIEYDRRLIEHLKARFQSKYSERFILVEGDACRVDFASLLENHPYRCVSNLPYSVSTPVVMSLATLENRPLDMTLLLQTEAAERFAAAPATKDYGAASVVLQHFYKVNIARKVPKTVFFPEPEVGSALTHLSPREFANAAKSNGVTVDIAELIRKIFTQRRKRLAKVAMSHASKTIITTIFEQMGLDTDVRAESLAPDTLWEFAKRLLQA